MCSPKVNEKSALPFPNHDFSIEHFCISLTSLYSDVNIIVNNIVHKGQIHFSTYFYCISQTFKPRYRDFQAWLFLYITRKSVTCHVKKMLHCRCLISRMVCSWHRRIRGMTHSGCLTSHLRTIQRQNISLPEAVTCCMYIAFRTRNLPMEFRCKQG